jgi:xanthine dehydrogenase YagR molybdenum-binding subunit
VARLIRTEKEVEGRYTEQWVVVEEDAAIDQWPAGPAQTVGQPVRGRRTTSGLADRRSSRPTSRCRGCCHARAAQPLRARTRDKHRLGRALERRRARARRARTTATC